MYAGVMAQPKDAVDEITQVDGVSILGGKYAVNAKGKILSPSSQKVPQLKAELTARNLSTEGNREELKRRVMVSHCGVIVSCNLYSILSCLSLLSYAPISWNDGIHYQLQLVIVAHSLHLCNFK